MKELSKSATRDLELIDKISNHNKAESEKAFKELFEKHYRYLLASFKNKTKDEEIAKDIIMETFLKLSVNLNKFKSEESCFSTWLYKVAINTFIDYTRKKALQKNTISITNLYTNNDYSLQINEFDIKDTNDVSPEKTLIIKERNKKIREIILSIKNPNYIKVIELLYFSGLSYEEISVIMDKPIGTIKIYVYRAKQIIKAKFEKNNIAL